MRYRGEDLKRMFEVKIYVGDPDAKKPKTRKETVIAWNEVDACRQAGEVSLPPKMLFFVWRENEDQPYHRIDSTAGPEDETVTPTIAD